MKIGIDARFYGEAGPGRYTSELIKNLEKIDQDNQYLVYLTRSNFDKYQSQNVNFQKRLADFHWYSMAEQMVFPLMLYREKFDLVHFAQINTPLSYLSPFVVTIHDLILHEFSMARGGFLSRLVYQLKKLIYLLVFAKDVYFSRTIIVPSQATKDDLLKHYRVDSGKIVVTPEAVDHYPSSPIVKDRLEVLDKYGLWRPYLLCLGSFYPHKNTKRLVEAFKILKDNQKFNGQLVLIGKESYFSRELEKFVLEQGIGEVIFLGSQNADGYLPDEEVEVIMANAHVYIQPALKEGFGIPPLEAMALGVPVVVSDIACLREMCGDSSLYFDPLRVQDVFDQLKLIIENEPLRKKLITKGYENIKRFSWAKMANETLRVYNSVD